VLVSSPLGDSFLLIVPLTKWIERQGRSYTGFLTGAFLGVAFLDLKVISDYSVLVDCETNGGAGSSSSLSSIILRLSWTT
jgi:hypothetical protein